LKLTKEKLVQLIKEEMSNTSSEDDLEYRKGKDDGLEDAQATEMGMQVYGPSKPDDDKYMEGYLEGNPNYQP
jgi:hypothetical protein